MIGCRIALWQTRALQKRSVFHGSRHSSGRFDILMTKRPSSLTQMPGGANPTVGLPGSGNMRATVQIPGMKLTVPASTQAPQRAPSPAEITQALHRGGQLFAAKKFDEAEEIAKLILGFAPKNADALHLLGLVTQAKGDPAEGERLMAKALKIAGPHAVLLVNLGNAARAQGKAAKARKYYDQAEALYPSHEDIFLERGILEIEANDYQAAIKNFDELIKLRPHNLAAYSGSAHAATELGQFRLAIDYCKAGIEHVDEAPVDLMAMLAISYERLSKLPETIEAAERVFEIFPDHCPTLRVWAKAKRRLCKRDPQVLNALRERLEHLDLDNLPIQESRIIHSELAHICDELGDVDAAFKYFQKQNEMTLKIAVGAEADPGGYLQEVEELAQIFTPAALEKINVRSLANIKADERQPVFLVGFPRSGTTLLDQIFDAHREIEVIEERPMLREVDRALVDSPRGLLRALLSMTPEKRKKMQSIYWRYAERYTDGTGKKIIVDKMPLNIIQIPLIVSLFPNAKIILTLRHPADCSFSCFMQDFEINAAMLSFASLDNTARLYDSVMTLWERYEEHLSLNVRRVHYEKLITDLRGEVEPVLNFIGLEWDEAMADPAAHARARGTIRTPSYAQVTQPIYGTSADRWRRYEKHIAPMMPKLEKHIRHFGYSL